MRTDGGVAVGERAVKHNVISYPKRVAVFDEAASGARKGFRAFGWCGLRLEPVGMKSAAI